jgi:hypothetical protein
MLHAPWSGLLQALDQAGLGRRLSHEVTTHTFDDGSSVDLVLAADRTPVFLCECARASSWNEGYRLISFHQSAKEEVAGWKAAFDEGRGLLLLLLDEKPPHEAKVIEDALEYDMHVYWPERPIEECLPPAIQTLLRLAS